MFNLLVEIEDLFTEEIIKSQNTYKFYELSDIPAGQLIDYIDKNGCMLFRLICDCLYDGACIDYYEDVNGNVLIDPYQMCETPESISAVVEDMLYRIYMVQQYSIDQIIDMLAQNIECAYFHITDELE
jgi:hypothetical protein